MQEQLLEFEANEAENYTIVFDKTINYIEEIVTKNINVSDVDEVMAGGKSEASEDWPEVFATFHNEDGVGVEVVINLDPENNKYENVFNWDYRVTFYIEDGTIVDENGIARTLYDQEISYMFDKDNKTAKRFDLNFVEHGTEFIVPTEDGSDTGIVLDEGYLDAYDEMQRNIAMEAVFGSDNFSVPSLIEIQSVCNKLEGINSRK